MKNQKVYKVIARSTDYPWIYVKADSVDDAVEYAENVDGGEFYTPDPFEGSWEIDPSLCYEVNESDVDNPENIYDAGKEDEDE